MAEEKSSPEESKTKPQSPEEAKQETKDDAPDSLYAKHLLQRKAYLLQNQQSSKK